MPRRIVSIFRDPGHFFGVTEALCALADDGTVWRRQILVGDDVERPTVTWERDENRFPPLPQEPIE